MMQINKFQMGETGSYNDAYLRPFSFNMNAGQQQTVNTILESTNGTTCITPTTMGSALSTVIQPTAIAVNQALIPNGWAEKRYKFMIEFEHNGMGVPLIDIIYGYTNYMDATFSGILDPNMRMYINSMVRLRQVPQQTAHGTVYSTLGVNNQQVLMDHAVHGVNYSEERATVRPEDVFTSIGGNMFAESTDHIVIPETGFRLGAKNASRKDTNAATFMSNILNAFANNIKDLDPINGIYQEAAFDAKRNVMAEGLSNNTLLNSMQGMSNVAKDGYFTYGTLCAACPDADAKCQLARSGGTDYHFRGSTQHWNGSDGNTITAHMISSMVSSIASDALISYIQIAGTNRGGGHDPYNISYLGGFAFSDNYPIDTVIPKVLHRIKSEVMPAVTSNNHLLVDFTITVDFMGDTHISLSIENEPYVDYCIPTFCDGVFSPFITNNPAEQTSFAMNVEALATDLNLAGGEQLIVQPQTPVITPQSNGSSWR